MELRGTCLVASKCVAQYLCDNELTDGDVCVPGWTGGVGNDVDE